jgi:hypothetical protein
MKLWMLLFGLLFVVSVYALEMPDACSDRGFNYTVSSWIWDSSYINIQGYDVNVWGDARKAYWNSTVFVDGVIYKSNNRTYLLDGGVNGTIPKTTLSNDMQWIVFCTNTEELPVDDVPNEVPEFTTIGVLVIIAVVMLGYKKNL